jgi:hypothetical protein
MNQHKLTRVPNVRTTLAVWSTGQGTSNNTLKPKINCFKAAVSSMAEAELLESVPTLLQTITALLKPDYQVHTQHSSGTVRCALGG